MPQLGYFRAVTITLACTLAMVNNVSCLPGWLLFVTSYLHQVMSGASISIALPSIGVALSIPQAQLQWLVSSYALTSVSSDIIAQL